MFSRPPSTSIESLEVRFAPARLLAGPLPPQFGADLSTIPLPTLPLEIVAHEVVAPEEPFIGIHYNSPLLYSGAVMQTLGGTLSLGGQSSGTSYSGTLRVNGGDLTAGTFAFSSGGTLQFADSSLGTLSVGSVQAGSLLLREGITIRFSAAEGVPTLNTLPEGFLPPLPMDFISSGTLNPSTAGYYLSGLQHVSVVTNPFPLNFQINGLVVSDLSAIIAAGSATTTLQLVSPL